MFEIRPGQAVQLDKLIGLARDLVEPGEEALNPEYSRALIELCTDAAGWPMDGGKEAMANILGSGWAGCL